MAFAMVQIGAMPAFAAGEIASLEITCAGYNPDDAIQGNPIPEDNSGSFSVTISTADVTCPPSSVYGNWYVEDGPDNWQPASGTFENGKTYAFRIDFDGIQADAGSTFATTMATTVNGAADSSWSHGNLWDSGNGTGWLMSAPVTISTGQATVTFRVVNGTWDGTDAANKTVNVTLVNGKGTLQASDIPTGMVADQGYQTTGQWDVTPNTTAKAIAGNEIYTYTFTQDSTGLQSGAVQPPAGTQTPAGTQPSGQTASGTSKPASANNPVATASTQTAEAAAPGTGDESNMGIYLGVMLASSVALGSGLLRRKKTNR